MRVAKFIGCLLAILPAATVAPGVDSKPAEVLAGLKREIDVAMEEVDRGQQPGLPEAEKKAAVARYYKQASDIARRALALVDTYPDAPEATKTLAWIHLSGLGDLRDECDAAYDRMATRYLDSDEFLPVIRTAWSDAGTKGHAEVFLRNAVERSTNFGVKALACFSLGRHQQQLARLARYLDNPIRNEVLAEHLGPENVRRIRSVKPEYLSREAEALFERTIREFADLQPLGKVYPPLGGQAEGALYRLRNLEIGCKVPELDFEDVDGKPMKLSDFRGQVVALSFWATWCGPCMGMIPDEKALVGRMKGRPFVLLGVNGDEDRARAREAQVKEGMTWRSFWGGGPYGPIPLKWGINSWPTVFVVDAEGVIRDDNVRGAILDRTVEALVAEAEAAADRPKSPGAEKPR